MMYYFKQMIVSFMTNINILLFLICAKIQCTHLMLKMFISLFWVSGFKNQTNEYCMPSAVFMPFTLHKSFSLFCKVC